MIRRPSSRSPANTQRKTLISRSRPRKNSNDGTTFNDRGERRKIVKYDTCVAFAAVLGNALRADEARKRDKQQAYQAIESYIANYKTKNRKLCDLSTYLKERRFVGKLELPTTGPVSDHLPT